MSTNRLSLRAWAILNKMIQKVVMYSAVCDNCGAVHGEDDGIIAWNDIRHTKEIAENSNWVVDDEQCYCPKCYGYDDNGNFICL